MQGIGGEGVKKVCLVICHGLEWKRVEGGEIYSDCGLTKGEALFTCLLPAFSALQMFLRASFITDILTILTWGFYTNRPEVTS